MKNSDECKKIIFNIGIKYGVSPRLISIRLLSKEDKDDMLMVNLPMESLDCAVKMWIDAGLPDYANGFTEPYRGNIR